MKKITLVFVAFAFLSGISAQEYIPFPPDSTSMWRVNIQTWNPNPWEITTRRLLIFQDGQTNFLGKIYNNFFASGDITTEWSNGNTTTSTFSHWEYCSVRTEGSIVYVLEFATEHLLFDYALQAGDTVPDDFYIRDACQYPMVVSSVDSVLIGNRYHKRYNFADPYYNGTAAWFIEGIGHQFGIVESACMIPDWGSSFVCYAENGESLFQEGALCELTVNIPENDKVTLIPKISPNPTTGLVSVEFNTPHEMQISVQILDITGRIIKNEDWLVNDGLNARCLDLSGFRNGFYMLVFEGNNGERLFNQRVVLQH
jgi:hypothetical protein